MLPTTKPSVLAPRAGQVEIMVQDSGVGIDPAFMAHVFERFRQGDASTTRQHGGLGLGLLTAGTARAALVRKMRPEPPPIGCCR